MSRRYTGNTQSLFDASPSSITNSVYKDYTNDSPEANSPEHVFQPKILELQFDLMHDQYRAAPQHFTEEQIVELENHAQFYGKEFHRNLEDEQFKIGNIIKQASTGFVSGFTTIEVGEQPVNKWERIARNVGHLGGFVGYVPGASVRSTSAILQGLARLKGKSVPMLVAGKVTEHATTLAKGLKSKALVGHSGAKNAAADFLNNKIANDLFEGAFHLGTASAVSSWTHGVDAMVSSALHGAAFGGVFRSIGNVLKSGAKGSEKLGEDLIGGMAGSLFQGLPSTLRGDTTPEQIAEYLMGAYFGFHEGPYYTRTANKYKAELANEIVGKKMPADKLNDKIAEDLLKRDWDAKEREAVQDVSSVMVQKQQALAMINEMIKRDPTLAKELEGYKLKMTEKGEIQAEADIDTKKLSKELKETNKKVKKPEISDLEPELQEDTGTLIEYDGVSSVVKSNAEKTLSKSWRVDGVEDLYLKRDKIQKLQKHLDKMADKKDMNLNRVSDFIKKEFGYDMSSKKDAETDRAFYRNYLKRRISMKPIKVTSPHIILKFDKNMSASGRWYSNIKGIEKIEMDELSPNKPTNRANNRKDIPAPVLYVEQVYKNEMKARNKDVNLEDHNQRPVERVDHITILENHGNSSSERKLSDLRKIVSRDLHGAYLGKRKGKLKDFKNLSDKQIEDRVSRDTDVIIDKFVGEITKAYNKKDMHYLSGRGDGDLSYYIKYHPKVTKANNKQIVKYYRAIKDMFKQTGLKDVDKVLSKQRSEYVKKYSKHLGGKAKAEALFNKTYVSNVLWEVSNNGFKAEDIFREYNKNGKVPKNFLKGFINDTIKFNKRQQIWLTNGTPVDHKAVNEWMKDEGFMDLGTNDKGQMVARTIITVPGKKSSKNEWEWKATDYAESNDGDTATRTDFVKALNYDAGHPLESGVTKNFVVSPHSKHGGLLMKHMHFDAGDAQSKAMINTKGSVSGKKETGIHFLTPESSAKQFGTREAYVTEFVNGEYKFYNPKTGKEVKNPKMYEVPLEDMKTVLSEKTSDHNIGDTRIPKQLATNLLTTLYHAPGTSKVTKEVIDNWFNDYHMKGFHGTRKANESIEKFKLTLDKKDLDNVIENLEDVSVPKILELLTKPGYEDFSARVYDKMARINRKNAESLKEEGESSKAEAEEILREADDFKGAVDKILQLSEYGDLGVYVHKITSPYRQNIVKNYIVNGITRPKMDSGMTARMQGYDLELQQRFPELQTRKDLYYLGDSMGNKNILNLVRKDGGLIDRYKEAGLTTNLITELKKQTTLRDLWEHREISKNKTEKKLIDDFFEGINVRIPMDSASGAHVLKFGGFTGRTGYTVLMHPESMRALGGADSDGDKAFIFFDMKKQYKDAYKNARNEFVEYRNKKNRDDKISKLDYEKLSDKEKKEWYETVSDNKEEFRKDFTLYEEFVDPDATIKEFKHRALMYSPLNRQVISQNAAGGRGNLGPAVVQRQVLSATHASLLSPEFTGEKSLNGNIFKPGEVTFRVGKEEFTMSAKSDPKELERARKLARASIAFPSDPLDEVGLVKAEKAFQKVYEGYFDLVKTETGEQVRDVKIMRKGINQVYSNINSAMFGKNVETNRAWDYFELKDKVNTIDNLPPEMRNSVLAKMAEVIKPLEWYDDLNIRVNHKAVEKLLKEHNDNIYPMDKETGLKNQDAYQVALALERAGFPIKINKFTRELLAGNLEAGSREYNEANDFLSNDLHNLVGYKRGYKYWLESLKNADGKLNNPKLKEIGQFVNKILSKDFMINMEDAIPFNTRLKIAGIEQLYGPKEMADLLAQKKAGTAPKFEILGKEFKDAPPKQERQQTLDNEILEYKKTLNKNDQKTLDWLLIAGFRVNPEGSSKIWRKIKNQGGDSATKQEWANFMHKTNQNRFAFNSDAVSPTAIKQFWKDYSVMFKQARVEPPKAVLENIDGALNMVEKGEGKINGDKAELQVEGKNKDSAPATLSEVQEFIKGYEEVLGNNDAFKRISEMKNLPELTDKNRVLFNRLTKALEKNSAYIGKDLELFIRGEFNKEADQMTIMEMEALTNMLEKPGTWFQETKAKFHTNVKTGKKDAPILSKWVQYMFPNSVDRLWLSKEMKLIETVVPAWVKNESGDWVMKPVKGAKPQHRLGETQYLVSNMARISIDAQTKEESNILGAEHAKKNLSWLTSIKDADKLHEFAILNLERSHGEKFALQGDHGKAAAYRWTELKDPNSSLNKEINSFANKKYTTTFIEDGKAVPKTVTGREVMNKIEVFWREKNNEYYQKYFVGNQKHIDRYFYKDKDGNEQARVDDFVRDAKEAIRAGKQPHEVIEIGIDHMNKMATHVMIRNTKNKEFKALLAKRFDHMKTGETENYWHHTGFDQAELTRALKDAIKTLKKIPAKNKNEHAKQVKKAAQLAFQLRNTTGHWEAQSFENWGGFEALKAEVKKRLDSGENLSGLTAKITTAAQNSRQLHVKGYDRTANAGIKYGKGLIDTYYSNMSQIMGREVIRQFELDQIKKYKNKDGKIIDKEGWKNAKAWKQWLEMYLNESMGFPTEIPEHVLNNKYMNIKGTAYHWFADSTVKNRINKIAKALNIKGDVALEKEIGDYMDYNKLRGWTNLEAKYQLATLLAHPKTAIANVFGGSSLTIQSTGFRHWKNARSHKFLRDNIDPTWTTKEDAGKWVESLGIIEQFLTYEAGLSPYTKDLKVKKAYDKMIKIIKKDPGVEDATLRQAWKESGLGDNMFQKAAFFMRKSERVLRRDSFLAHYLQAKEIFGEGITGEGAKEHPFLIEWGRRGVQDTQFLYTAAFRPAFARSALGKVMTRFQLWAWNSVRFRNKVLKEAKMYGYVEGTPQFERFKRTAVIDLMVFGLASAFTYSLFEANLPAPYNWIQDTADWLFGDEKARDRAFFGSYPSAIAPLQAVTPPAARLVGPTMKAMIDGDWDKMSNYYLWTLAPFGRLARDVKNSIENPIRTVENLTGIPYIQTHRYLKNTRQIGEDEVEE